MKTLKIHEVKNYDRLVLIVKDNNKIIDIDFMQGTCQNSIDELMNTEKPVNTHILEIFNRLVENAKYKSFKTSFKSTIDMANYACELYCHSFIFQESLEDKKRMKLHNSYKEIIKSALKMYAKSLDEAQSIINENDGTGSEAITHVEFDITMLQAFAKYDITVNFTENEVEKFSSNGIDLPIEFNDWLED